jgi:maleylpyruvate isomerase
VTPPVATALAWAGDGAAHLRGLMTRMGDDAFAAPSGLPGWSRAHVLTHVARGADAMINLLTWARTGVRTPAYADGDARDADIAAGAARSPAEIRADVVDSSDRLAAVVRAMPEDAWSATVEHRDGSPLPVRVIPWFRARETWIHAVDLDVGASLADLPAPMLDALITETVDAMGRRPDCPAVRLVAPTGSWAMGAAPDAVVVEAPAHALAAWLLDRPGAERLRTTGGARPPALPGPWPVT